MYIIFGDHGMRLFEGVPDLETMQTAVDGYIERVVSFDAFTNGHRIDIFCNEEGLLLNLPFLYRVKMTTNNDWQPIAGHLIVTASDEEGESVELHEMDVEFVTRLVRPLV